MHSWRWRGRYNVAYETYGSGDIPLLLIHGMGACHEHWNKLIPELSPQYKVYAMDLLGFGELLRQYVKSSSGFCIWRLEVAVVLRVDGNFSWSHAYEQRVEELSSPVETCIRSKPLRMPFDLAPVTLQ